MIHIVCVGDGLVLRWYLIPGHLGSPKKGPLNCLLIIVVTLHASCGAV